MIKNLKFFLLGAIFLCGALFLCNSATATIIPSHLFIDFRDSAWSGAYGKHSETVGDVTATALPGESLLWQDGKDGLGIKGGEVDEIDAYNGRIEELFIEFNVNQLLTGVWITDLFKAPDGGIGEHGKLTINGISTYYFDANDPGQDNGNGELFVSFGGAIDVFKVVFATNNLPEGVIAGKNEFSVAGFTNHPVPEPATMMLLGFGLIGIAAVSRKKFFKKNNA